MDEPRDGCCSRRSVIVAAAAVGVAAVVPAGKASTPDTRYLPECLNLDPRDLAFEETF